MAKLARAAASRSGTVSPASSQAMSSTPATPHQATTPSSRYSTTRMPARTQWRRSSVAPAAEALIATCTSSAAAVSAISPSPQVRAAGKRSRAMRRARSANAASSASQATPTTQCAGTSAHRNQPASSAYRPTTIREEAWVRAW
ncbi:hypothetical protein D3C72_1063620 [compost metagenome]